MEKITYATEKEIEALLSSAKNTRYPIRNKLIILMLFRHGLRESELCNLKLSSIDFDNGLIYITRLKNGINLSHPIAGDELRLIKRYIKVRDKNKGSGLPYLFISSQGNKFSRFSINKIIESCYLRAGIRKITPHMLRHSCGFYLVNKGYDIRLIKDYLGHKNIENTTIYTKISGVQFKGLWD